MPSVSYTHLDVYKRQVVAVLILMYGCETWTLQMCIRDRSYSDNKIVKFTSRDKVSFLSKFRFFITSTVGTKWENACVLLQ